MSRKQSSDSLTPPASACPTSRPPSYYASGDENKKGYNAGSFPPQSCNPGMSSGRQTPVQYTPDTTIYGGSEAGSMFGHTKKKTSQHKAPHCPSCTCVPPAKDPNTLRNARGQPYGHKQLVYAAVTALATYNGTQDAPLKARQMEVMHRVLKQSELPWTEALYQNDPPFEPSTGYDRDVWVRGLINPKTGFPVTLEEAFEATCDGEPSKVRKGMKGAYQRLQMALLDSEDDDID